MAQIKSREAAARLMRKYELLAARKEQNLASDPLGIRVYSRRVCVCVQLLHGHTHTQVPMGGIELFPEALPLLRVGI